MEINEQLKTLAKGVAMLGDHAEESEASRQVLLTAVLALVRTHPDPSRFAGEFRRVWMRLGSPNESAESGSLSAARIDESLNMIEEDLPVPLGVRPPRD